MNEKETTPHSNRDYCSHIARLQSIKGEGNQLINSDVNRAIAKYEEANEEVQSLLRLTSEREKESNPQLKVIEQIKRQIASNLALCYFKLKEYQKSIDYDKSIIAVDSNYDKSYARLCKCSMALKDIDSAVRYGRILKAWFNQETLDKYAEVVKDFEVAEKEMKEKTDKDRVKENSKEQRNKIIKLIPYMIVIGAAAVYSFY